jgi:hypothetical protein
VAGVLAVVRNVEDVVVHYTPKRSAIALKARSTASGVASGCRCSQVRFSASYLSNLPMLFPKKKPYGVCLTN